jgi:phenylalanyl-tRNA synthetase beta chain
VAENYDIKTDAYVAVLDLKKLASHIREEIKYRALARFPAITRDISLVMKKAVLAGQIEEIIRSTRNLEEAVKVLIAVANEAGGKDNISVTLIDPFRSA